MSSPFFRPHEVAELYGVEANTVNKWTKAGKLEAQKDPGGRHIYLKSKILADLGLQEIVRPDGKTDYVPATEKAPIVLPAQRCDEDQMEIDMAEVEEIE